MRYTPLFLAMLLAYGTAQAADDLSTLSNKVERLTERILELEKQNQTLRESLNSDRVSENEPELSTRLKAVEFQTLSMQKQARQIEALEGITVGASLTSVVQGVNAKGSASGKSESRTNYRGDISVTLPGGEMGNTEGKIFTHFRFGQGNGLALRPTYTSTANSTAFQVGSSGDDSFGVLAQGWYQLKIPLNDMVAKDKVKEHLYVTFGKIDPFVFFDQNAIADDESTRFMNNVFVHNPLLDSGRNIGTDSYGFAPGAIVQYTNKNNRNAEWGLSLGVFSPSGTKTENGANFNGAIGAPLVIMQAETTAKINHLPGNYRVYLWRNGRGAGYDNVEREHTGIGLSIDQKVTEDLTLFGRYGHQFSGKVLFDRAVTLGGELSGSDWGRSADSLGLAFGALRTSKDFKSDSLTVDADGDGTADYAYQAGGWEKQMELYYRFKVNSRFDLTANVQRIINPGGDKTASDITTYGLRAKVGF